MWRERLSERGKLTGLGWSSNMTVEAHVVNLRHAAVFLVFLECFYFQFYLAYV